MTKQENIDAFKKAIAAEAWDAEWPRLIYADWLEENDEPEEAMRQRKWTEAARWLHDFAARCGYTGYDDDIQEPITFDTLVQAGHDWIDHEDYFTQIGSEEARTLMWEPGNRELFWEHWQTVTGIKVSDEQKEVAPFSCSC